jgi:hypothetical protein
MAEAVCYERFLQLFLTREAANSLFKGGNDNG